MTIENMTLVQLKEECLALEPSSQLEEADGNFVVSFSEESGLDCTDTWDNELDAWRDALAGLRENQAEENL